MFKECTRCGTPKPLEDFQSNRKLKNGKTGRCKECANKSARIAALKAKIACFTAYSDGEPKCACCGETELKFLSLDHVNGGGKQDRTNGVSQTLYIRLRREGWPSGYRILCFNCNHAYGHYVTCPHQEGVLQFSSR